MPDPGQATGHVTKFCGNCGQSLLIPTNDLTRSVRCPRCRALHNVGVMIDRSTPIAAVTVSEVPHTASSAAKAYADTVQVPAEQLPNSKQIFVPEQRPEPAVVPPVAVVSAPGGNAYGDYQKKLALLVSGVEDSSPEGLPVSGVLTPTPGRALDRAAQGVAVAVAAASQMLEFADKVDSFFYGKRATILVFSAGLVAFAPTLKSQLQWPWFPPLAIAVFLFVLSILALARIAMLTNEDGRWVPSLGIEALKSWMVDIAGTVRQFRDAKPHQRQVRAGRLLISLALISLASRAVCDLVEVDFNWPAEIDWLGFFVGALVWALGVRATRKLGTQSSLYVDPTRNPEQESAVASAFAQLPEVVDCRDSETVKAIVAGAGHPLAAKLMSVTSTWRPRSTTKEKGYQRSFKRHLDRQLPECDAMAEVPLRKARNSVVREG